MSLTEDDDDNHSSLAVRSILTCPGVAVSRVPSSSSAVRSVPSVLTLAASCSGEQRPPCRLVASHSGRTCHLISHFFCPDSSDDTSSGSMQRRSQPMPTASRVARCRINFDRDLGAVALAKGKDYMCKEDDDIEPILFVADTAGRLWRSGSTRDGSLAFSEGFIETNAGTDTSKTFKIMECIPQRVGKISSVRKCRCLPLGVDLLSVCSSGRTNDESLTGTFLVASGSESILPPVVVYAPRSAEKNVLVEEISGLEATTSQIVSVLFVSKDCLDIFSWRRLVLVYDSSLSQTNGNTNALGGLDYSSSQPADSAVLLGMSDGSVFCSLVSAVVGSNPVESLNVGPAARIFRLRPQQSVASMFLVPNATSSGEYSGSILVCMGRLGAVALIEPTAVDAGPLFLVAPGALPRLGTWTSAAPFQCYCLTENSDESPKQHTKCCSIELSILAACDDGSTYVCPMRIEQSEAAYYKVAPSRAGRLPVRKDVASVTTCSSGDSFEEDGMYLFTFSGSLLVLRVDRENQSDAAFRSNVLAIDTALSSSKRPQPTCFAAQYAASDSATLALKQLCNANFGKGNSQPYTKSGANDSTVESMHETRNAERIVSLNSAHCSLDEVVPPNGQVGDNWFHTCHVQQPLLADIQDLRPLVIDDLAQLCFEGEGRSYLLQSNGITKTKVTYAGAAINHCFSFLDAVGLQYLQTSSWNRRPLVSDDSLSSTFEHSGEADNSLTRLGVRLSSGLSNRGGGSQKRKLVPSVAPAGVSKSAHSLYFDDNANNAKTKRRIASDSGILGLVKSAETVVPARWSVFDEIVSGIVKSGTPKGQTKRKGTVSSGSSYFVNAERSLIGGGSLVLSAVKTQSVRQSIMLSSCSALAKWAVKGGLNSKVPVAGLDSVSIDVTPSSKDDSTEEAQRSSSMTTLRFAIAANEETDDLCSALPLLRSRIVCILAERLVAPNDASAPFSETEAANLLDLYHHAVKSPRTRKMARYLMSNVDECLVALKQSSCIDGKEEEGTATGTAGPATPSVLRMYNQLRTIPLPLG